MNVTVNNNANKGNKKGGNQSAVNKSAGPGGSKRGVPKPPGQGTSRKAKQRRNQNQSASNNQSVSGNSSRWLDSFSRFGQNASRSTNAGARFRDWEKGNSAGHNGHFQVPQHTAEDISLQLNALLDPTQAPPGARNATGMVAFPTATVTHDFAFTFKPGKGGNFQLILNPFEVNGVGVVSLFNDASLDGTTWVQTPAATKVDKTLNLHL